MKQNKALQAAAIRQKKQNDKLKAFFLKNNVDWKKKESTKTSIDAQSDIVIVAKEHNLTDRIESVCINDEIIEDVVERAASHREYSDVGFESGAFEKIGGDQVDIKIPKTFVSRRENDNDEVLI